VIEITKQSKTFILFIIVILTLTLSGCFGGSTEPYKGFIYKGAYLDIITSHIPTNEFNNDTLYSQLLNKIETNFSFVLEADLDIKEHKEFSKDVKIYISYNERMYVGHRNLENSLDEVTFMMEDYNIEAQSSAIYFLSNHSILIESILRRHSSSDGDYAETETKALEQAIDLFVHDQEFFDEQTSKIIEIIISVYNVDVIFERYIPRIRERH
jgi:hypothetical protein